MRTRMLWVSFLFVVSASVLPVTVWSQESHNRLFFLHHSTGRKILEVGEARSYLTLLNTEKSTDFVLWDHDYNYIGLSDPSGTLLGYNYAIPWDNTDPIGLHRLWTTENSARDSILSRYDTIAFKSCFPASQISSDTMLQQYKDWYLAMREVFDQYPEKIFIAMSPPPLHRLNTNVADADRARAFADWMGSDEYLGGHPNLAFFDLFDHLAHPADGSEARNMLRYDYEISHLSTDSHPNVVACTTVAPLLVDFLVQPTSSRPTAVDMPAFAPRQLKSYPNPFNPVTTVAFSLDQSATVRLEILDLRGRLVRELYAGDLGVGAHEVPWDGRDAGGAKVASGVYFYRLSTGNRVWSGKMVLAK